MSTTIIPIKDSYHCYRKGVTPTPAAAYNEARQQIARKYFNLMKAMPDTAAVSFQEITESGNGGSTTRIETFDTISVTGAGSKTKGKTLTRERSWETWFDVHYVVKLIFVPSDEVAKVSKGQSIDDVNREIANDVTEAGG